ncbi:nuclear pore complex subunit [Coemansia aciculifera]|uniref:Nuclear pore complex subunit n=1 Tax=Coemansia aciculifera TaxID=417176 RepID=A0A9W8IDK1_9FUNG|nr:nuclear pore complex subunit [Coemansia aciculifera]
MIGLSDTPNLQAFQGIDTDEVIFDEDEEVLATGRLPMCASPVLSYTSHSQELPSIFATQEQEEQELHSSYRSDSTEVYLDIIPAEHWHGPNWRNMQFPQYTPDRATGSSRNLDACNYGDSSFEMLEQHPQLKRKRFQRRSNNLVTPQGQGTVLIPDYAGLRDLDRNYTGHRYAYVELLVQAWAQGHCQTGDSFSGEEITLMSQLARQTPSELGRSLRDSHSICLQRCPDISTADNRSTRWRMVADNDPTSEDETRSVIAPNFGMLSRMVATLAQYAAMLPAVIAQGNTAESEEYRPPKRAAAKRVTDYSGMFRPDPNEFRIAAPRSANSARRRPGAAPDVKAPRGRVGRPPKRVEAPVNIKAPVRLELDAVMDLDHEEALATANTTSGRRVKRSTTGEKQSMREKRAAATDIFTRYQDAGLSIQELLVDEGVVVQADSLNNCPIVDEMAATPFVPIMFQALNDEPAHYIVDSREKPGTKMMNQTQGFHEYGVDGFPVPVVPERWLEHQRRKYKQWCDSVEDCENIQVQVSNLIESFSCMRSPVQGPLMCRGCVTRQTDCPCRFRYIRVVTKLEVVVGNKPKLTRYIVAPMFASQADSASTSLIVKPAPVSRVIGDLASGSSGGGDATAQAEWSELYSLYMTAPTLLHALDIVSPIIAENSSVTPLTSVKHGVLPEYGCSAAPCVYRDISPGFRQSCDMCATSIMSVCFTCCMCATEMCVGCFSEWDDEGADPRVSQGKGINKGAGHKTDDGSNGARRYSYCKQFNGTGDLSLRLHAQHKKRQFVRLSQFSAADIHQVLEKVRSVVGLDATYPEFNRISCAGVISDTKAQEFAAKIARIEQRTREMYPHEDWELPVMYVQADELSTAEFSCLWRRGVVVVVRGLLSALNSEIWQPEWWIKNFGDEVVGILDCADGAKPVGGAWPLRNFYRLFDGSDKYAALFGEAEQQEQLQSQSLSEDDKPETTDREWKKHRACVKRGILKLKDWPPTDDFESRLPDHFKHFMKALPFPEYTQRAGQFNLVNRLPAEFVPPDLGPKMYCAYGSSDGEGGVGTTNLHCDMADAVNIMAYAPAEFLRERNIEVPGIWTHSDGNSSAPPAAANTDAPAAAAVWDIYPPEAMSDLRKFIGKSVGMSYSAECSGPVAAKLGDPIHNQETFLTQPMRKRFFEKYEHSCYRIYQIPGDAVFVPAGCAHQVCNYASAVKVAMDFVSPERVEHSRRLTEEFRQLNNKHPRNRDLLQLGNILWWTFAGEQPPPEQPELSDSYSEDERQPRRQKQQAKSGNQPKKQAKKSVAASGAGSKARPEPKAKDTSSKDRKRHSHSSLSSLSSSFSIEEQEDVDSDDILVNTLLEESKRLTTHLTSSEIPSVHRGLDLLESESRKLVARSVRNGKALDPRAQSMLASSGVDTDELTENVASAALLSAFEMLQPTYDANVESFLGQQQEQSIINAIEESQLSTLDDFDRNMSQHMHNVWEDTQRRLFEELGQYQAVESRPFLDSVSLGDAGSSLAQQSSPAFGLSVGGDKKCTQPRVERYAQVVRKLNDARVSSSSQQFELLAGLEKATADSSQELKSKQIGQVWKLLEHYTALSLSSGATTEGDMDKRLVAGACEYLEKTFIEHVDSKIAQYPHDANIGGVPSVERRVKGYLKILYTRTDRAPRDVETFEDEAVWAHLFMLYRCGYKQEALAYALKMEDVFDSGDSGFVTHLKAFLDNSPSVRSGDVPVATTSFVDPFKAALYRAIGRGNVPKNADAGAILTTEDYMWINLAQIRDADKIGSRAGSQQNRDMLETLQASMLKHGPAHFDPSGNSPLLYFRVLLLCGLFENAIDYLLQSERFQIEAVHMAIALVYYKLLRLPTPLAGSEPTASAGDSSYLVASESAGSVRGRFDFSRLIIHYARALSKDNADDDAISYLLLLTLPGYLPSQSGISTEQAAAMQTRKRSLCEQAIVRILYERQEYAHFLGDIQSDGTRKRGVLERFLPLLGITTSEQFSQTIIRRLADRSRDEGRLADTVLLYNLGERYNTVLNVLCKQLGEVLHQRSMGSSSAAFVDSAAAVVGLEDVEGVARAVLAHYRQREHISRVLDDRAVSTCSMLLAIIDFANSHQRGAYEEALELIESTNLLPLGSNGDVTGATQHAEQVRTLDDAITRNFSLILLTTMDTLSRIYAGLKESPFLDAVKQANMQQLRRKSRGLMVFAGMIQFRMPSDTFAKLNRMDVFMN